MKTALALAFLLSVASCAHSQAVSCPGALDRTTQSLPNIPQDWQAESMPVKHTLSSFQINFGDPASPDGAIYDERTLTKTKSGDDVETLTWNLSGMKDPFMVCGYTGTNIILTRKVSGLSKCQAVSVKKKGMGKFEMQSTSCS